MPPSLVQSTGMGSCKALGDAPRWCGGHPSGIPLPASGLQPSAGLRRAGLIRSAVPALQRPEQRNQHTRRQPRDEVHRHAHAGEVGEAVVAGGVDQGVGLVADGGGEAAAGGEHDADDEGARVDAELLGDADDHRGE